MRSADEEVECVRAHKESNLRAEDDARCSKDKKGSLVASLRRFGRKRALGIRKKVTQG